MFHIFHSAFATYAPRGRCHDLKNIFLKKWQKSVAIVVTCL
jgi:hypothetical protein